MNLSRAFSRNPVPVTAVWTVPNLISFSRILLIGVFMYLLIAGHDLWAIGALVLAGVSDFFDGYLARRWDQSTTLGRILDPAADRLLTVAVVLGLGVRGMVPWWLVVAILARDVLVGIALLVGRRHQLEAPQVTFVGKSATLALYFALPLAFLAFERWPTVHGVAVVAIVVSAVVYWWAGIGYIADVIARVRANDARARSTT